MSHEAIKARDKVDNDEDEEFTSGKWENENIAQVPFKVYRKPNITSGLLNCSLCLDDKCFMTGYKNGQICLWDTESGEIIKDYKKHNHYITQAKLFYEGQRILTSSYDMNVCVSDMETGATIWSSKHPGLVTSSDVSPDDKVVVSVSDFDYSLYFWDFRNGKLINRVKGHHDSTPLCCTFSPDGQRVASTGIDANTKIYDLISQKTTVTLTGHENVVSSCRFSHNQLYLCTSSWDKTLQIYDISTGAFRSQGSKVLVKDGHIGSVSCCAFSPDDTKVISGGYDESICVWDTSAASKIVCLRGHKGWITSVDVTSNGQFILSASEDSTLRLWDISNIDDIPLVQNARRTMTGGLVKCDNCGKAFIIAEKERMEPSALCVFCRLDSFTADC